MRIEQLTISNFRGVRQLSLEFGGDAAVIWGRNGAGKSSVVDALDFLFSGDIGRLTGRQGLSLQRHGKHIDAHVDDSFVEAKVKIPGHDGQVTLRRSVATPRCLESEPDDVPPLAEILSAAGRRQHMLTRATLLRFIDATPRNRADAVAALLNLDNIERVRRELQRAAKEAESELRNSETALETSRGALGQRVGVSPFNQNDVIERLNEKRRVLGAHPVSQLSAITTGLSAPASGDTDSQASVKIESVERLLSSVKESGLEAAEHADSRLQRLAGELDEDRSLEEAVERVDFWRTGLSYVEDAAACPLCDKPWAAGDLKEHISEKIDQAERAKRKQREINDQLTQLAGWIGNQPETLQQLIAVLNAADENFDTAPGRAYAEAVSEMYSAVSENIKVYSSFRRTDERFVDRIGIESYRAWLSRVAKYAKDNQPKESPRQAAWDSLAEAERLSAAVQEAESRRGVAENVKNEATRLLDAFKDARESVLGDLYRQVRDRFVAIYKQLHAPDEAKFAADLSPTDAGLDLQVDFHASGLHSPMALHSEGHQDSMGLCLFLALSERVLNDQVGFRVLDDVVMSVDSGHRRPVAQLLAELGEYIQFIVTTHDRVWSHQLRSEGAVRRARMTELVNWSRESGPVKRSMGDFWRDIEEYLDEGQVQPAAAALRHGLEGFLGIVADALGARVAYSIEGRVEFGDLYTAVVSKQTDIVKKAIQAASSWSQQERVRELRQLQDEHNTVRDAVGGEIWMVNPSVHFNSWNDLAVDEFRPVVKAFQRFCATFECDQCSAVLRAQRDGASVSSIVCRCGQTRLNLQKKNQ